MQIPIKMYFDRNGNEIKTEYAEVNEKVIAKKLRGLKNEEVQIKQAEV